MNTLYASGLMGFSKVVASWGAAKESNTNEIKTFHSITIRVITNALF